MRLLRGSVDPRYWFGFPGTCRWRNMSFSMWDKPHSGTGWVRFGVPGWRQGHPRRSGDYIVKNPCNGHFLSHNPSVLFTLLNQPNANYNLHFPLHLHAKGAFSPYLSYLHPLSNSYFITVLLKFTSSRKCYCLKWSSYNTLIARPGTSSRTSPIHYVTYHFHCKAPRIACSSIQH